MTVLYLKSCYNEVCYKGTKMKKSLSPKVRILATPGKYRKRALN